MASWEDTFKNWAKPSSDTEAEKQANAERMIREVIREDPVLSRKQIDVFAQGSYRNNTNVRQESDVDICVCNRDEFFYDMSHAKYSLVQAAITPTRYTFSEFKNQVQAALERKFGKRGVTRGTKAFEVHENSYRVDADVVPCWEFREYYGDKQLTPWNTYYFPVRNGVKFIRDLGAAITNYPEQHYQNGVAKNKQTGMRFKPVVRILKRLRYHLEGRGVREATGIPSFLIESLIFNVEDDGFADGSYVSNVRWALATIFNKTISAESCENWIEVNGMKYLFRADQPWTWQQAHAFVSAAWDFVGYK